jgi:hypothetical protein
MSGVQQTPAIPTAIPTEEAIRGSQDLNYEQAKIVNKENLHLGFVGSMDWCNAMGCGLDDLMVPPSPDLLGQEEFGLRDGKFKKMSSLYFHIFPVFLSRFRIQTRARLYLSLVTCRPEESAGFNLVSMPWPICPANPGGETMLRLACSIPGRRSKCRFSETNSPECSQNRVHEGASPVVNVNYQTSVAA